jgi:hypothetical protein
MSLTRSQLIAGNSGQGIVLNGQVQGVTAGGGVQISSSGAISFNAATATGVVKLNNPGGFNGYIWPAAFSAGGQLTVDTNGNLTWIAPNPPVFGLGLNVTGTTVRASVPIQAAPPTVGSGINEALDGSLYWDCQLSSLFVRYNNAWVQTNSTSAPDPTNIQEQLLTGTYHLYVDSQIGSDVYVNGVYDSQAVPVVTNQQITCGYTPQSPFKTIARAAIEVARITGAGSTFDPNFYDRIVIHVSSGDAIIDNSFGSPTVTPWVNGVAPSNAQLVAFNSTNGGVILPRGVSVIGEDLRKTIIRPTYVPPVTGDQNLDRTTIFHMTGGSYFFNFTFKDKLAYNQSHHLVDCFQFISDAELQAYYNKVQTAFGFAVAETPANPGETEIVAPAPVVPTTDTDGVTGSSPYIFNCSIRSLYGLCGIHADGAVPTGFKSVVVAQFTGVSLQKDLRCWQLYNPGTKNWGNTFATYTQYINAEPNNVRMDPSRLSAHIRALNEGVVQEVSVFAIGQGIHHWAQSGSDLTVTNSNSNFGGCSALAEGYKSYSFPTDTGWNVSLIRVANNLTDKFNNIKRIYLGTVTAYTATTITVATPLGESIVIPGQPDVVGNQDYTLRASSYVWIDNPYGNDWRTTFTASPWTISAPTVFNTTGALLNQDGQAPGVAGNDAIGKRLYIRRLVDVRTPQERRFSLLTTNTAPIARNPLRDYVIQTTAGAFGIQADIPANQTIAVNASNTLDASGSGAARLSELVISRQNTSNLWTASNFYRTGDVVEYQNKHWRCIKQTSSATFILQEWDQCYVQMGDNYYPPDFFKNVTPIIIFDNDTSGIEQSVTLGYNLTTVWSTDSLIINQYRSATDFRGCQLFLIAMGFTQSQADQILTPLPLGSRDLNPAVPQYGIPAPNGAAYAWTNWAIQFRRMTNIRLFGQAWEWAGYLNYTKSLPQYQKDLTAGNQFTYYFTNANGGVVYASGFNQEGYVVTPAGLLDLTTGQTISVENIGNGNLDLPTILNNLTLTGTTTIYDNLDIQANNVSFSTGSYATTSKYGVGQIATIAELDSGLAASTDSALDAAGPNFVTPQGLEHWKIYNRLVSQRTTLLVIYVLPNWSSPTVSNPQKTIDQMLLDPPTSVASAVPLASAALYGNTVLSSTETAEYRLSVGVFTEGASFNHNAVIVGGWNFGGASPTQILFNPSNFDNPALGSQFATVVTYSSPTAPYPRNEAYNFSPFIQFNGTDLSTNGVNNIFWVGVLEVLRGITKYPNVLVSGGAGPRGPAADYDSFLLWCKTNIGTQGNPNEITYANGAGGIYGNSFIVNGCVFGAIDALLTFDPGGVPAETWLTVFKQVQIGNCYIRGNLKLTSASGFTNLPVGGVWGNRSGLLTLSYPLAPQICLGIQNKVTGGPITYNYAFVENGINLVNNSGAFPAGTGVDAPGANDGVWDLSGPVFFFTFQTRNPGTSFAYSLYSLWPAYSVAPASGMGWYGRFGTGTGSFTTLGTRVLNGVTIQTNLQYTGNGPWIGLGSVFPPFPPSGGAPGSISAPVLWDWLNVRISTAILGIDVSTGNTVTGTVII